jgi:hypothetical protein
MNYGLNELILLASKLLSSTMQTTLLLVFLAGARGGFLPPNTAATRLTSDMVLCYMDARSEPGPQMQPEFVWNPDKFAMLLAKHDKPLNDPTRVPVDTLFDSFLFTAGEWFDGKSFWPGQGTVTNASDWLAFLDMQLTIGATNLDAAALAMSASLPLMNAASGGLRPSTVLTIPGPDPRQESFGVAPGLTRSLNFTLLDDRIAAVEWFTTQAAQAFAKRKFRRVFLAGFYWYVETIQAGDDTLLPTLSTHIKKKVGPSLFLLWIPYFQTNPKQMEYLKTWRTLGFDFVTLQPNFAFHNSSADERFATVKALATNYTLGVELELPDYVRNPTVKDWRASFDAYIEHINEWSGSGRIMRSYYYGNAFVASFATNTTNFAYYERLYSFVKRIAHCQVN